ncbi:MAG: DUF2784 domain-containing protein [Burkholderiaceae bacterium]
MLIRLAADGVLLLHAAFIAFALLGGLLALGWRWAPALHLPAVAWAFWIELSGGICPLTTWENLLRTRAGQSGYSASFVEHYLLPLIYPAGLTRDIQYLLAGAVVLVNLAVYAWVWHQRSRQASRNFRR